MVIVVGNVWFPRLYLFQDYEDFFEALEHEELYEHLQLDIPEEEVEYIRKHKPVQEVTINLEIVIPQQTQNICRTFVQCCISVEVLVFAGILSPCYHTHHPSSPHSSNSDAALRQHRQNISWMPNLLIWSALLLVRGSNCDMSFDKSFAKHF